MKTRILTRKRFVPAEVQVKGSRQLRYSSELLLTHSLAYSTKATLRVDSPLLLFLSNVVCVVRVMGGPLYSLERLVPTISLYENIANRLLEDQINLPAKMHLDGKQGRFGRTTSSASPTLPPLATVLLWYTA